jgi:hypothetical protein
MHAVSALLYAIVGAMVVALPAQGGGPLETALWHPDSDVGLQRMRAAGASTVHVTLNWRSIAPARRPPAFQPEDPEDPAYEWGAYDRRLQSAARQGLRPLIAIYLAPAWAEGTGPGPPGTVRPDPVEFGRFARAAALRYSGRFDGLPRVRHWQAWLEPNLHLHLNPQLENGRPIAPAWYRQMVNQFADAVRSVDRRNVVVAGGFAPFRDLGVRDRNWGPLTFMREMLCISKKLKPTCRTRVNFDIWSHHPFTSGGPTRHAVLPDDVSIGDLPEMRRLLTASVRAGHVGTRTRVRFWVTEFGWDTKPPDPRGVPIPLHTRWVAEGLYRMWKAGVSLVTWVALRDAPLTTSFYQFGLYFRGSTIERDRPKPALRAFRFPFVGFPRRNGIYVWGRTPAGEPGRVLVEQSFRGGWRRLGVLRTNRYGIFEQRLRSSATTGSVRARVLGTSHKAVPFSLKHVPDRFFNPFGQPTLLEPRRKPRP